jgi:hypothetical protein
MPTTAAMMTNAFSGKDFGVAADSTIQTSFPYGLKAVPVKKHGFFSEPACPAKAKPAAATKQSLSQISPLLFAPVLMKNDGSYIVAKNVEVRVSHWAAPV